MLEVVYKGEKYFFNDEKELAKAYFNMVESYEEAKGKKDKQTQVLESLNIELANTRKELESSKTKFEKATNRYKEIFKYLKEFLVEAEGERCSSLTRILEVTDEEVNNV